MTDTGFVQLERERSRWTDRFRSYKVVLDGEVITKIRTGDEVVLPVDVGDHNLAVRIDWSGSDTRYFTVEEGQTIRFVCSATPVPSVRSMFQATGWVALVRVDT